MRSVAVVALVLLARLPLAGQQSGPGQTLAASVAFGRGSGPTPSAFWGGSLVYFPGSNLTAVFEASRLRQGVGVGCGADVPYAQACDLRGTAILVGPGVWRPVLGPVSLYGTALGGLYITDGLGGTVGAAELDGGLRLRLDKYWRIHAGGRLLWAFNSEWARVFSEGQHYRFWDVGLELRVF